MKKNSVVDSYLVFLFEKLTIIAPAIGICAASVLTCAKVLGAFPETSLAGLILFNVICCTYPLIAFFLKRMCRLEEGRIEPGMIRNVQVVIVFLPLLHWNLISYIYPFRGLWGYACLFLLVTAFLFESRVVLIEIIGLSVSIFISWLILPEALLPLPGPSFWRDIVLRVIELIISFSCVFLLTRYSENFKTAVQEHTEQLLRQNEELENLSRQMLAFTADIVEERDLVSGAHIKRVRHYTECLARKMKEAYPEYRLTDHAVEIIAEASMVHDVGKIGIPDSILQKPGKLTEEEFEQIKTHTKIGAEIMEHLPSSMDKDFANCCRDVCLFHHEKYDGRGYPKGLIGEEIPVSAQIVSIVDCFDALTTRRPYKEAYSPEKAAEMILRGECGAFSDRLLVCFRLCMENGDFSPEHFTAIDTGKGIF